MCVIFAHHSLKPRSTTELLPKTSTTSDIILLFLPLEIAWGDVLKFESLSVKNLQVKLTDMLAEREHISTFKGSVINIVCKLGVTHKGVSSHLDIL